MFNPDLDSELMEPVNAAAGAVMRAERLALDAALAWEDGLGKCGGVVRKGALVDAIQEIHAAQKRYEKAKAVYEKAYAEAHAA